MSGSRGTVRCETETLGPKFGAKTLKPPQLEAPPLAANEAPSLKSSGTNSQYQQKPDRTRPSPGARLRAEHRPNHRVRVNESDQRAGREEDRSGSRNTDLCCHHRSTGAEPERNRINTQTRHVQITRPVKIIRLKTRLLNVLFLIKNQLQQG